jgi:hypothetical protein
MEIICAIELIIISILILYIWVLSQRIKGLNCKAKSSEQLLAGWREKLLDKVKEKIVLTEQSELLVKKRENVVSQFIYQQKDIKVLEAELFDIFYCQVSLLKEKFSQLTELDILVILLLGIGMDNLEICTLLRMEKRTLYRRRQLIGMRMNQSSTLLDKFAIDLLANSMSASSSQYA